MKVRIDVEKVQRMCAERCEINVLDIRDIEVYENGKLLNISDKVKEDFEFTGLSNVDFISSRYFEKKELFDDES
jgi:hypothetical protein